MVFYYSLRALFVSGQFYCSLRILFVLESCSTTAYASHLFLDSSTTVCVSCLFLGSCSTTTYASCLFLNSFLDGFDFVISSGLPVWP